MRNINVYRVILMTPVLILVAAASNAENVDQHIDRMILKADKNLAGYVQPPVPDTDRPGSDYKSFYINDKWDCIKACQNDPKCVAWTFVKPGYQGPQGRCYLKNADRGVLSNKCCESGFICKPIIIETTSPLPSAVVGGDYKYQIKISNGFPPNEFYPMQVPPDGTPMRVDNSRDQRNSMPLGLKLSRDGFISGQVQSGQAGYIPILIQVRDSCPIPTYQHITTKKFMLEIKPKP